MQNQGFELIDQQDKKNIMFILLILSKKAELLPNKLWRELKYGKNADY
jgi:hypothetical protein